MNMKNKNLSISEFIKLKREERALSQRHLAELCGVSNTEIWQIETGKRKKVQPFILRSMAPHLGVSYEELMKIAGYISNESAFFFSYTDEEDLPEYVIEAIGFMRFASSNLNENEFRTMLQMAKSYYQTIMAAKAK
jgi:transcriptional regulator with XRE-family HTH domain